ncbi:2-dehydropantoate 2-reductase [Bradyrhizobium sp. U87765 SZCCT0131]|uniref:2-dehydropantoate 2-reductase n=1 Tax=unclassified Bradyrhizobium TaxID=2631580 RepID=UPI001BA6B7C0|nr:MULTISPECIES: 2-dehydropantoate 2-reductase [unclassified Bradyrhizobium]MBR1220462.1 2-dehydropantoate 2-reductase [Bradyrhizobium sp. U87765 SZCCT0131]MBR1263083.1 2-dehydropantoate 2-reductase [Bradyrhizobium sp. U87765 SZCCT0134]MBR1307034.1 2-dehydropantoate 2-reductase [Bradyrhizobium sp. U87765 SZCCT0110]MBR1323078.1 2-dehydropantoate 2-reductase [Bradyrhizobium sp. U87765 SZCCT0109]MBR1345988.1 2-dehydropantoate 2-reductase [Bradyrhizobium sp. U87765 SZCCT0048]
MRVLVIGAGALGGYFGARLLEAGRDVTFLVRPRRAEQLRQGLVVKSPAGDITLPHPPLVTADRIGGPYDLVLLSCKAYDLDSAMDAFAPAVGPTTMILPLLNGMAHLDALNARFGAERVLGGQCVISATLDDAGHVVHFNDMHSVTFGEQGGGLSERVEAVTKLLSGATFVAQPSSAILQDMWEKWVFIATGAGMTSLMRAAIGDIVAAGGADLTVTVLDECARIAAAHGFAPRAGALERSRAMFTAAGSPIMASMLRDIERGARIEADQIIGDLLRRGDKAGVATTLLPIVRTHLKAYEARRQREQPAGA